MRKSSIPCCASEFWKQFATKYLACLAAGKYKGGMEPIFSNPRHWLEYEYMARRKRNPQYSLRAFARHLEIPSGRLSQLLSEKRSITPKLGKKIATHLQYDPEKMQRFLNCVASARPARSSAQSIQIKSKEAQFGSLDMDEFQAIADPVHFAFLSLMETKDFQNDSKWISERLEITVVEVRQVAERLERIGLIKNVDSKLLLQRDKGLTTSHDVQSAALRKAHKKVLESSVNSLEEIAVDLRDITSMTMAIDPAKLKEAKSKIRQFRRSLCGFLETGEQSEVYRLNIQLIPVTRMRKK